MTGVEKTVQVLLFVSLGILALWLCVSRPMHNWDMVMYTAAAKSFEEEDINEVHSFTYDHLSESVSGGEFIALANPEGNDPDSIYRSTISSDAEAMAQQLPMFQIRPAYTGLIYVLYRIGLNIISATYLISGVSVFCGIILLYPISRVTLPRHFIYLVPAGAAAAGVLEVARYSTPDGLAFFAVVSSIYLLIKKRALPLLSILPLLPLVRTDLILFILPLYMMLLAGETAGRAGISLSALASILVFILINSYFSNPGWSTTFHSEFMEVSPYPLSSETAVSAGDYFRVMVDQLGTLFRHKKFLIYIPAALFSLYLLYRKMGRDTVRRPVPAAAAASLFYVLAHFLIFPDAHERFFAAQYIIGGIAFLHTMDRVFLSKSVNNERRG